MAVNRTEDRITFGGYFASEAAALGKPIIVLCGERYAYFGAELPWSTMHWIKVQDPPPWRGPRMIEG